jgi:hypothetical protein
MTFSLGEADDAMTAHALDLHLGFKVQRRQDLIVVQLAFLTIRGCLYVTAFHQYSC